MAYRNSERPLLQDGKTMQISNYMADKFEEQKSEDSDDQNLYYVKDPKKQLKKEIEEESLENLLKDQKRT
jgi:hypothetical protein